MHLWLGKVSTFHDWIKWMTACISSKVKKKKKKIPYEQLVSPTPNKRETTAYFVIT